MDIDLRMETKELISDLKQFRSINPNVFYSGSINNRTLRILEKCIENDK